MEKLGVIYVIQLLFFQWLSHITQKMASRTWLGSSEPGLVQVCGRSRARKIQQIWPKETSKIKLLNLQTFQNLLVPAFSPLTLFTPLIFPLLFPLAPWFNSYSDTWTPYFISSMWLILHPCSYLDFVSSGDTWGPLLWTASSCISPVKGLLSGLYSNPGSGQSGRALTSSLLSAGDCISQQYELALGNLNVLSLLSPYIAVLSGKVSESLWVSDLQLWSKKSHFTDIS